MTDPEFLQGGAANPRGGGVWVVHGGGPRHAPTYDFAKCSQKCMKIKEFGPGEGRRTKFYYVNPPLQQRGRAPCTNNNQKICVISVSMLSKVQSSP